MSNNYWAERMAKSQDIVTQRTAKMTQKQLEKYYQSLAKRTIKDFESVYDKILKLQAEGKQVTPADLYKLDKYWEMQGSLRQELRRLGEKEVALLTKQFELNYFEVYHSLNIEGMDAFKTIDKKSVQQMINQIWCADGKSWSQRIWQNTELLAETLNEELVHCVATGKKTTQLKQLLQDRFGVAYHNADMLVRTELAHIQTQAAKQRYQDYGIEKMEVWVDEDERTCKVCASHEGEVHLVTDTMPVPFHPRCRCCMVPVIEDTPPDKVYTVTCKDCKKTFTSYNEQSTYCPECKQKHYKKYNRIK